MEFLCVLDCCSWAPRGQYPAGQVCVNSTSQVLPLFHSFSDAIVAPGHGPVGLGFEPRWYLHRPTTVPALLDAHLMRARPKCWHGTSFSQRRTLTQSPRRRLRDVVRKHAASIMWSCVAPNTSKTADQEAWEAHAEQSKVPWATEVPALHHVPQTRWRDRLAAKKKELRLRASMVVRTAEIDRQREGRTFRNRNCCSVCVRRDCDESRGNMVPLSSASPPMKRGVS